MENQNENNIYKHLKSISQLQEKGINYQSLNYDLGFFKDEINLKINELLELINAFDSKFKTNLTEKTTILDHALQVSNTNTNNERLTSNIKTENIKKDFIDNEKQLEIEIKQLDKEEDELLKDNYNHYQAEYVEKLKTLTSEKKLITENHQHAIDFIIEKYQKSKQNYKDQYQLRIDKIRQTHNTFLDDIKRESETFIPLKNDFYQELNQQTNECLQAIKNIQDETNSKINTLSIFYDKDSKLKEEELKLEFANLTNLKKTQLQNKINKNEEIADENLIHINNLEAEILIKQFTYKENIIKTKIGNLPTAYSLYKKYQLLSYTNKRNLILLEKGTFLKELDSIENHFVSGQNANKKILELKTDSQNLYFNHSVDCEKADIEYNLKKNSAELQNELQTAEISKRFKLEQNRIYTEIERLRFIFRKIDDKFSFAQRKSYNNNILKKKKYTFNIYKKRYDIENNEKFAELQKKDISAIINYNILLNKNYQLFKKKYIDEVISSILTINLYIHAITEKLFTILNDIFKMILIIFDNCYYMSDKFFDYLNIARQESKIIINLIKQISQTTSHLFIVIKTLVTNYSSQDTKHFKLHSEAQMLRINNQINELMNKEKHTDKENNIAINTHNNEIRRQRKFLINYLSQIRKLKKIKAEEAQETKIKYLFGFKKAYLDYIFLKRERQNLYRKQKNSLHYLAQNEDLNESVNNSVKNFQASLKQTTFSFFKKNDNKNEILNNRSKNFTALLDGCTHSLSEVIKNLKTNSAERKNIQKNVLLATKLLQASFKNSKKYLNNQFFDIKDLYNRYLKLVKTNSLKELHYHKAFEKKELNLINYQLQSYKQNLNLLDKLDHDYSSQMDKNFLLEKKNKNMHQDLERKILNKNIRLLQLDIKNTRVQENSEMSILKTNIQELQNSYLGSYKKFLKDAETSYNIKQNSIANNTKKQHLLLKQLDAELDTKYYKLNHHYSEERNSLILNYQKKQNSIIQSLLNISKDFKDQIKTSAILLNREIQIDSHKIKQMKKMYQFKK